MSDDADRRMRLLEMAGGDLDKVMKLECWVQLGVTDPNALAAPVNPLPPRLPSPRPPMSLL